MTALAKNIFFKNTIIWIGFVAATTALFFPVLSRSFVSDDYYVLYRIIHQKTFIAPGFFRPLSDLSLYSSYLLAGLNPFYYNVCNIVIHASCGFMVYRICLTRIFSDVRNISVFAYVSAALFIIYPFHNEAVIWAIGRGIVLSGFFSLLALWIVFSDLKPPLNSILGSICYFISLCGYETSLPLPLIVLLILYVKGRGIQRILPVAAWFFIALVANLCVRVVVTGSLIHSYTNRITSLSLLENFTKFIKTTARLILPPSDNSMMLVLASGLVVIVFFIILKGVLNKDKNSVSNFWLLTAITFLSALLPAFFGVSTLTLEGDRVFYFSSAFLCIWIGWLLSLLENSLYQKMAGIVVVVYFLFFFYQSVITWRRASEMANSIITTLAGLPVTPGKIYVLNIPDEYNGAQVFRNGIKEAFLLNKIDTARVQPVNYVSARDASQHQPQVNTTSGSKEVIIYPAAILVNDSLHARIWPGTWNADSLHVQLGEFDRLFYWRQDALIEIKSAPLQK